MEMQDAVKEKVGGDRHKHGHGRGHRQILHTTCGVALGIDHCVSLLRKKIGRLLGMRKGCIKKEKLA